MSLIYICGRIYGRIYALVHMHASSHWCHGSLNINEWKITDLRMDGECACQPWLRSARLQDGQQQPHRQAWSLGAWWPQQSLLLWDFPWAKSIVNIGLGGIHSYAVLQKNEREKEHLYEQTTASSPVSSILYANEVSTPKSIFSS